MLSADNIWKQFKIETRANKMSGLVWIQTVWHFNFLKRFYEKGDFEKKCRRQNMQYYPASNVDYPHPASQTIFFFSLQINLFFVMSGQVFLGWTSTKLRIMCFAQGHNTVPQTATPKSRIKQSNTEPLRSSLAKITICSCFTHLI